jgi:NAD(P)-dependent dehydrogenase (short-subunit alcohol dehydrogenase family)
MATRSWFITGTSGGLGKVLTEKLLARGDRVTATVRKPDALADLQAKYAQRLWVATMDMTDTAGLRRVVNDAFARMGRIDVIVSNAGYGLFGAAEEVTDAQISQQIATNLTGSIQLIRAALPHLRAQGGGRILQVSSEGGQMAYPGFSLYHATKWGIEGFVEAVAKEVAPFGIDFVIVEPGPTQTNFGAGLVHGEPVPEYTGTPADQVRRSMTTNSFPIHGDAGRTVDEMIVAADSEHPTLRLTLGSTAYASISKALSERSGALEAQRNVAYSADIQE